VKQHWIAAASLGWGALAVLSVLAPAGFWAGLAWMAAIGGLLGASLLACYRPGEARARWIGFAVFGWSYLALSFNHWPFEFVEGSLLTTRAWDEIYLRIHPDPTLQGGRIIIGTWGLADHKSIQQDLIVFHSINQIHLRWAWHALAALALGAVGSIAGRGLWRSRSREGATTDPDRPPRWRLSALMALIVGIGLALAALRSPSGLAQNLAFTTFAAAITWAMLAAAVGPRRRQPFWAGFALFGWAYLLAAFGQFDVRLLTYGSNPAGAYLPSSRLFGELYPIVHPEPADPNAMIDAWNPGYHRPGPLAARYLHDLNRHYFVQTGHALSGLLAGLAGGLIAARAGRTDDRTPDPGLSGVVSTARASA